MPWQGLNLPTSLDPNVMCLSVWIWSVYLECVFPSVSLSGCGCVSFDVDVFVCVHVDVNMCLEVDGCVST